MFATLSAAPAVAVANVQKNTSFKVSVRSRNASARAFSCE
jgi:hypothetical protein